MNEIVIRACRSEEAEAVLGLWREADATVSATDTVGHVRRANEGPAFLLVAQMRGRLVGSVIGTYDGWRGNIYRLVVHLDHRRYGIGRRLLIEVLDRLADEGAQRITALVESDHSDAMAFGNAVGWELDRRMVRFVRNLS